MKTRVLIPYLLIACFVVLGSAVGLGAQSLAAQRIDPSPLLTTPAQAIVEHHGMLTNKSGTTKNVIIRYFSGGKYLDHTANMCADLCYELPDDFFGAPYDLPVFTLAANTTVGLKAILNPRGFAGTSTLNFIIFDRDNPSDSVSYSMTFIVDAANSVRDLADMATVEVAPNPSSDRVTISSAMLSQATGLVVYAADGRIVCSQTHDGSERTVVDVSDLAVGLYHVVMTLKSGDVYRTPISVVR